LNTIWQGDFSELVTIKGYVADDGWVSPLLLVRLVPNRSADAIVIRLWNPDKSARFTGNTLYVAYGDADATHKEISAGKIVEVRLPHASVANRPELLTITSDSFLLPDAEDRRTRGVLLLGLTLSTAEQPEQPRPRRPRRRTAKARTLK
jgi:hypothetical protein